MTKNDHQGIPKPAKNANKKNEFGKQENQKMAKNKKTFLTG